MSGYREKIHRHLNSKMTMLFIDCMLDQASHDLRAPDGLTFRELEAGDYPEFSAFLSYQSEQETVFDPIVDMDGVYERLESGERCFICGCEGIAGYLWHAMKRKYIHEIGATLELAEHETYSYNGYLSPAYRGKGIIPYLMQVARGEAMRKGFKREITARMVWNRSAERLLRKLEFNPLGSVTVGYFLTFRYVIDRTRDLHFVHEIGPFELYRKLWRRLVRACQESS